MTIMRMTEATPVTGLPSTDSGILEQIERLASIGDIKLLDRFFLESVCVLLPFDYVLLCLGTVKGRIVRVKRYRDSASQSYHTCWQQEPLSGEQLELLGQARRAAGSAHSRPMPGRENAAFTRRNERGASVNLLVQYPTSVSDSALAMFHAFTRIYFNFRSFMDASQRDPLTGLLNRRYFDDCIHRALEAIGEEKTPFSVDSFRRSTDEREPRHWLAILDIDHFKKFNDSYGHLYGDEILLLFSRIMEQTFRESDLLFRFGGEEFVVLMENASADEATAALERFRRAVQDYAFPQGERVTVSCGAIEAVSKSSATALLGKADEALYHAKKNGRNRIVMYEELLALGAVSDAAVVEGDLELF